ncbi:DNA-directed RNA polymerase subunit alpha [Pseudolycoriella hygida]|uniref:Large ribosomal subunit protein bL17c n=1 Tax=Pseudolycoriella hygida TaxID=35572 RepID=A0A9Q0N736_9DIPT|nr:DNA-directed RNA polymerase subunit alpha [Pseudolycoriella hygida]
MVLERRKEEEYRDYTIVYENSSESSNSVKVVIEPLERGFGLTVGNAMRRILLSSLQGAAITSIKIPGVAHEFSAIPGVKEDLVDVVLNLKSVIVKMHSGDKRIIRLNVVGPCKVTAGMITTSQDVEVLTPDHMICTLAKGAHLEMELICETGKGYVPAISNDEVESTIGVIPIDALFSPVRKVTYKVENTRVGQVTDYDKLIMTVETNGSIPPEMAIALAARVLQDQLQLFITFEEQEEDKQDKLEELSFNPAMLKKVGELELSVRSQNCLQNANIIYIGDLVIKTEAEMLKTPNFGRKSLNEIKDILVGFGLKFGKNMRHKIKGRKLNRTSSHREAMFANMAIALVMNEQIKTTLPKAKELRPYIEKLVTKAKKSGLASRRGILSKIKNKVAVQKLVDILGKRYNERPGGYTRIIKAGFRYGDMAPVAYIEFVDRDLSSKGCMTQKSTDVNVESKN